jgi:glycogen synthase
VCALDRPDLELTMLGGGPLQRVLEQRVKDLGLSGRVTVLGAVAPPEVFEHLRTADLLVHASRYETFGMTMVEAIAAGVPVLATRCGGPEETLAEVAPIAAELVPVADGVTELVAGYRRLRDRLDRLDLPRARALLEDRYGYAAVSRQLTARYFPDGADPDRADRVGP